MSFFCTLFKSASGSYVSKVASRQFLAFLYPKHNRRHGVRGFPHKELENEAFSSPSKLKRWFICALVRAAECDEHCSEKDQDSSQTSSSRASNRASQLNFFSRRELHTESPSRSAAPTPESDRQELLDLVDYYDDPFEEPERVEQLPNLKEPDVMVSEKKEDAQWSEEKYRWRGGSEEVDEKVRKLEEALRAHKDGELAEDLFELYEDLPSPRIPYLSAKIRHKLLYHLATVDQRDQRTILRYLSVVDDMKVAAIPLLVEEWNMTLYFAGKFVHRITEVELETGLRLWREMEREAGVPGNHATFNILFDMAIKAGKYKLADMIYGEMLKRGHEFNRFHHVSKIYYHGLQRDGDSARKAYKTLVESGEIVDTVVLNCLIVSLVNSQEPHAATQVYERMKLLHSKKSDQQLPPRSMNKKRQIRKALLVSARVAKHDASLREKYQAQSIVAPDSVTFRTLLQYYALEAGELEAVTRLVDEMNWYLVPVDGRIFLLLFEAFHKHGGLRYSEWTGEKLERVWRSFLNAAVNEEIKDVYVGKWAVIWGLRAFRTCVGSERVLQVWEEVRNGDELRKWVDEENMQFLLGLVNGLTRPQ